MILGKVLHADPASFQVSEGCSAWWLALALPFPRGRAGVVGGRAAWTDLCYGVEANHGFRLGCGNRSVMHFVKLREGAQQGDEGDQGDEGEQGALAGRSLQAAMQKVTEAMGEIEEAREAEQHLPPQVPKADDAKKFEVAKSAFPLASAVHDDFAGYLTYSPHNCPDVTVLGAEGLGHQVIFDVATARPMADAHVGAAMMASGAAASKVATYGNVHPHQLVPFGVEVYGGLGPAAVAFLKRTQRRFSGRQYLAEDAAEDAAEEDEVVPMRGWLAGARLVALLKDGLSINVRPIACGEVLRKLVAKVFCKQWAKAFSDSVGGGKLASKGYVRLRLGLWSKAGRSCGSTPCRRPLTSIRSGRAVTLYLAAPLQTVLERVREEYPEVIVFAYLDDGFLVGPPIAAARAYIEEAAAIGLDIQPAKSAAYSPEGANAAASKMLKRSGVEELCAILPILNKLKHAQAPRLLLRF
eukprot:gene34035-biopygen5472